MTQVREDTLLRTHVGGGAEREAGLRQTLPGGIHGSG
jgi:hypothetical protein